MKNLKKKKHHFKDKKYMQWVVENRPCLVCRKVMGIDNFHQIQFHHLQGKYRIGAMIRDDRVGLPICYHHHHQLTFVYGERKFWDEVLELDPKPYADKLYEKYRSKNNVTE